MRRSSLALASGGLALALAAAVYTAAQSQTPADDKGTAPPSPITFFSTDRGPSRSINFVLPGSAPEPAPYTLTADEEIDVSSIIVHNGSAFSQLLREGQFYITLDPDPGPIPLKGDKLLLILENTLYFSVDELGTETFTFDPPLRLREGDRVGFWQATAGSDGYASMFLQGTPPADQEGIIIR